MRRLLSGLVVAALWAVPTSAQNSNILDTGAITANSSGSACTAVPQGCAIFQLGNSVIASITLQVGGTYVGTLGAFEATSSDNPVTGTWFAISGINLADGSSATAVAANGTGQFSFQNSGLTYIRVRATAWTSGTATITAVRGYASARWLSPFLSNLTLSASGTLAWSTRAKITSPADGILLLQNAAGSGFTRLQFGCSSASCPSIERSGTNLYVKLANDTGYGGFFAGTITATTGYSLVSQLSFVTAPTISSGFGTTPSIVASNGTATFTINVGTGGVATTGVIGFPSTPTGWKVDCWNTSANTATVFITKQTGFTTTTATIGNYDAAGAAAAWTASNVLVCSAQGF